MKFAPLTLSLLALTTSVASAQIIVPKSEPDIKAPTKIIVIPCEKGSRLPHCIAEERRKLFVGDPAKCNLDPVCREMFKAWTPKN